MGRGLVGVLSVLLLGPVGGAHGERDDGPPAHQQTTCNEVLDGEQGWELKQETDPEADSEVRAGDHIDVRMTWDATDFADGPLYNVLDCVTVDAALDTALSLVDRDAPNDGEFTYRVTVPGGLSVGTEICSRGAIAGDGNGYFELNPSNDACFTVAEGGTPPEPPSVCAPGEEGSPPPPSEDCAPPEECAPGGDDESPPPSEDCAPPEECAPGDERSPPPSDDCAPPTPPEVCAPADDGVTPPEGCTPTPETPRTPPSNEPPTSAVVPPSSEAPSPPDVRGATAEQPEAPSPPDVRGATAEQPEAPEVLGPEVGSVQGDGLARTGRPERAIIVFAGVLLALGGAALIGAVKRPKLS